MTSLPGWTRGDIREVSATEGVTERRCVPRSVDWTGYIVLCFFGGSAFETWRLLSDCSIVGGILNYGSLKTCEILV